MLKLMATTTVTESTCRLNIVLALHQQKVFIKHQDERFLACLHHHSKHLSPRRSLDMRTAGCEEQTPPQLGIKMQLNSISIAP